jgi:hypothetical protein
MSRMSAEEYLLSLMRAEHLPDLFRGAALGALALFEVEGAYVLRLEMGRWRVVGAAGVGKKALGLRLPREWEPPSGPTPPPGPLGFSPDGREREGFALRRGNLAFLLEGALPPSGREEHLSLLLEALALRAERLASLSALDFLLSFGKRLRKSGSLEGEVRDALGELLSYTGFSAGAIFRLEEGVCRLWVVAGEYPEGYLFLHLKEPVSWGEGATRVLRDSPSGFALIPDYQFYPHALPAFQRQGLRTVVQVLLERSGEPYGILSLASFGRTVAAGPETERLLLVARDELEAYLERRLQVEGTLEAIARILEGLDYETEGHMRRVSHLAVLLGVRAGVRDLEGLRMGAYLHDLGKLFLPREVLNKPGNLDTGEWQAVMTHPEMGYEVLSRIPFLPKTALEVVLHHHEHWDGTGYPKGLKGEEIPLVARVFAVADVWDALLSRRAYKPALAEDAARMELLAMAGRKLDPGLVELFLEQLEAVGP